MHVISLRLCLQLIATKTNLKKNVKIRNAIFKLCLNITHKIKRDSEINVNGCECRVL